MICFFARLIITDILVIHKRKFSSEKEALAWNERTGICMNFDLISQEQVDDWKGEIIWVPEGEKK